jgi:hypothetical protein
MSGDHRNTANYKKELLTGSGFKQYRNTSIFLKDNKLILSPAVDKNQQGRFWFDVREVNISRYNPDQHNYFAVVLRIVPDKYIFMAFSKLQNILKSISKTENTGNKVWSFEIEDMFTSIVNKKSKVDKIFVSTISELQLIDELKRI